MADVMAGSSGALFNISGTISVNSTWDEYIYFLENGAGVSLTGMSFQLQFRTCATQDSSDLTLSTADSQLVITADDNAVNSILRINVPYTPLSGMSGDYIADLVAKDQDDKLIHYAHGVVTFREDPIAF